MRTAFCYGIFANLEGFLRRPHLIADIMKELPTLLQLDTGLHK